MNKLYLLEDKCQGKPPQGEGVGVSDIYVGMISNRVPGEALRRRWPFVENSEGGEAVVGGQGVHLGRRAFWADEPTSEK